MAIQKGYAVVSRDFSGVGLESEHLESCVRYCQSDDVVVEWLPKTNGVSISVELLPWKETWFMSRSKNHRAITWSWFRVGIEKVKIHRPGKVVFDPKQHNREAK